jgi:hypothetical protein
LENKFPLTKKCYIIAVAVGTIIAMIATIAMIAMIATKAMIAMTAEMKQVQWNIVHGEHGKFRVYSSIKVSLQEKKQLIGL